MRNVPLFSADSHVVEPPELWTERMPKQWRDRAPRVENRGETGDWFVADKVEFPVALSFQGPTPPEKRSQFGTYAQAPLGAWEPDARLKEQDTDGVDGEVIYPSNSLFLFMLKDLAYQQAVFATYNDWLIDFVRTHPKRLVGVALIASGDPSAAALEIERCAKAGLKGVLLQGDNPLPHFGDRQYDPIWTTCQELKLPVSFHSLTSSRPPDRMDIGLAGYMAAPYPAQLVLATLIYSGVLERFPKMQVVSAENDTGWIPHFLFRLDHGYLNHRHWSGQLALSLKPSDYFRRQIWSTFMEDPVGVELRHHYSSDRLMWGSDYPHGESTWPRSREIFSETLKNVSEAEYRAIANANVRALYQL